MWNDMQAHRTFLEKDCILGKDEILKQFAERGLDRIVNSIELQWGYPEGDMYLAQLIVSDRDGRQGFPREVMDMLLRLQTLHSNEMSKKNGGVARPMYSF